MHDVQRVAEAEISGEGGTTIERNTSLGYFGVIMDRCGRFSWRVFTNAVQKRGKGLRFRGAFSLVGRS